MGPGWWWVSASGQCNQLAEMNIFFQLYFSFIFGNFIHGSYYVWSCLPPLKLCKYNFKHTSQLKDVFLNNPLCPVSVAHMCMMWYHPPEFGKLSVVTSAKKRVCPSHNNYILLIIRVCPGDHPPHICWAFGWLDFARVLCRLIIATVFMSEMVMSYPRWVRKRSGRVQPMLSSCMVVMSYPHWVRERGDRVRVRRQHSATSSPILLLLTFFLLLE